MEEKQVTIELIVSLFKNYNDKKTLKDIKQGVFSIIYPDALMVTPEESDALSKEIVRVLSEDKKMEHESFLEYKNKKYQKRKNKKPITGEDLRLPTQYIGTAGECAVMSELMFRGYNANRMMIDEGIDIVATKDNLYYYIQVKTVALREGRIHCQIPRYRFDQYVSNQIRYIIVARASDGNLYYTLTPRDIEMGLSGGYIKASEDTIHIKIKFHPRSGEPFLYDEKEHEARFYANNFRL